MVQGTARSSENRFTRYRENKRRQGMKLIRLWVPDPNAPGFREEAERQALALRGSADEIAAAEFGEAEMAAFEEAAEPYDWGPEGPPNPSTKPDFGDRP